MSLLDRIYREFLTEVEVILLKKYYFAVNRDFKAAQEIGLKKDSGGWYLPKYNTSGRGFDLKYNQAVRLFNREIRIEDA